MLPCLATIQFYTGETLTTRRQTLTPSIEFCERRLLLATINASIASFAQQLALDTTDTTNHTAWGFPGMTFAVNVQCPSGTYVG